jgi:site-specific recombinase XerD
MSVAALLPSWQLAHESANRSPKTVKSYTASVRSLAKFLRGHDMPDDIEKVGPEHIRAFLVSWRERTSPTFGQQHYRNLHVYFRWIEAEGSGWRPIPWSRSRSPPYPRWSNRS